MASILLFAIGVAITVITILEANLNRKARREKQEWLSKVKERVLRGGHLTYEEARLYNKFDDSMKDDEYFITKQEWCGDEHAYNVARKTSYGHVTVVGRFWTNLYWAKMVLLSMLRSISKKKRGTCNTLIYRRLS